MRKKPLVLGCIGAGAIALLILLVGGGLYFFIQYRNSRGTPIANGLGPQITINNPAADSRWYVGTHIDVMTFANGTAPFLSTELWIDGVIEGVHVAPPNGADPFAGSFIWVPAHPGIHLLIARGIDSDNNTATSRSVRVLIVPFEDTATANDDNSGTETTLPSESDSSVEAAGEQANELRTIVFPSVGSEVTAPQPPTAEESISSAEAWQGSLGEWITNLTAQAAPAPPELVASANGCDVLLTIRDRSFNEEGFTIRRQLPNAMSWHLIETLASQSNSEWITYSDIGISGPLTYSVTAFNSHGDAISNLVLVDVDAADCPADPQENPMLTVELRSLTADQPLGQAYCYNSLNGVYWTRWPETGFFALSEEGLIQGNQGRRILLNSVDGERIIQSLDFQLECWQWQNGALQFLGEMSRSIDPQTPEIIRADIGKMEAEIEVQFTDLHDDGLNILDLEGGSGIQAPSDPNPGQVPLEPLALLPPTQMQMPFISAWISFDPAFCKNHLEPAAKSNPFAITVLCHPFPGYNIGPAGANPQPYLVWLLTDTSCPAGFGADCWSHSLWEAYANNTNGNLGFRIEETANDASDIYTVGSFDHPARTAYVVPGPKPIWGNTGCSFSRSFRVQMVYEHPESRTLTLQGPKSNVASLPCTTGPITAADDVTIEVTFQTLHLSNIDDGIFGGDDVEVKGLFAAKLPTVAASGSRHLEKCQTADPSACLVTLTAGVYPIATLPIYGKQNNNKVLVQVGDGEAIELRAVLLDYDPSPGSFANIDYVCKITLWTEAKSSAAWAGTLNEVHNLISDSHDADCQVDVILNAVSTP